MYVTHMTRSDCGMPPELRAFGEPDADGDVVGCEG